MSGEKGVASMFAVSRMRALVFLAVLAVMPALIRPFGRVAGAIPARLGGVPGRLAVENARRSPRRTATTTIALTIGVGLMSLFAVVGASSKASSERQLDAQFPVDFQIQNQFGEGDRRVPHAVAARLAGFTEIGAVIEKREKDTRIGSADGTVNTLGGPPLGTVIKPSFVSGSAADLEPGTALADKDTAARQGLAKGRTVQIKTDHGTVPVRIAGVFGGDTPLTGLLVPGRDFDRYFSVRDPSQIYVKAADGATAAAAREAVQDAARPYPTVKVGSAAEIKEEFTKAIDMVLMIFAGLLGLAVVIALFGIANTLTLSVVERTRESALLRALGLTKRQLRRMLSVEALVMAVIGAVTGVLLGTVFGWAATRAMADDAVFAVPYLQIVGFVVLAGAAGMLAAVLPARRAARASIVESLAHD